MDDLVNLFVRVLWFHLRPNGGVIEHGPGNEPDSRGARCHFKPSTFPNLYKLAHSEPMVAKGDNFTLHQRTFEASGSSRALDVRSISAINKKRPRGELNFPIYYCALRLRTTFVSGASSGLPDSCR